MGTQVLLTWSQSVNSGMRPLPKRIRVDGAGGLFKQRNDDVLCAYREQNVQPIDVYIGASNVDTCSLSSDVTQKAVRCTMVLIVAGFVTCSANVEGLVTGALAAHGRALRTICRQKLNRHRPVLFNHHYPSFIYFFRCLLAQSKRP